MRANDVKNMLGENDIISLLEDLGAEPRIQGNSIVCKTVCHCGSKHKLIYFNDSKSFKCFTDNCGVMDIFGLVSRVINLDFFESFKYVCIKFGISYQGSYQDDDRVDNSFKERFKRKEEIHLKTLPTNVLNTYYDLYHKIWVDDGISVRSMKKFEIKFSIADNQIIIPHYDIEGNLIGVRSRNLHQHLVDEGRKYMPVYWKKQILKHPTGSSLFGLNLTKKHIEKYRTVILFESEKSVLQLDTMWPEMSIGVCISGSSLTEHQIRILRNLEVENVIIALDKEFEEVGSQQYLFYQEKINRTFIDKLQGFNISVIWDTEGLLSLKDSPTDHGLEIFNTLFKKRILVA